MFLNLRRFPKSVNAIREVVDAIRNRRIDEIGSVCEWPEDLVRAGDWSPVQWFDPKLALAVREIQDVPNMVRLGEMYKTGPAGQRIHDAFERVTDGSASGQDVAVFDSVATDLRKALAGEPDAVWRPKATKESLARSYTAQGGWMLVASRARTNNARVVGVCGPRKCVGTGFIPVRTETSNQARALSVLWNSTPTLLQLLNMRSKMLMYPKWSVVQLESVKVPESLGTAEAESKFANVFDRLADEPLKPWAGADTDPIRCEIDDVVAETYGISAGVLADWRERLAREPTVANRSPL